MQEELGIEELHYAADELTAYFSGEMPDDEAELLETHLGRCGTCKSRAEYVSEKSTAWFAWTPEAHREAVAALIAPIPPPASVPVAARSWWITFWTPARIAFGALAVVLITLAVWKFATRNGVQPPERAKQIPPPPRQVEKEQRKEQAKAPPSVSRPVVAALLVPDLIRRPDAGEPINEVQVPPGGCTIRLDIRPDDMTSPTFAAIVFRADTGDGFEVDQVTKGRAKDGNFAVQVSFPSEKVRNGEYAVRLSAGASKNELQEIGTYVFTVTGSAGSRPAR